MGKVILDSSALIAFEHEPNRLTDLVEREGDVATTTISASELLVGLHLADAAHQIERETFVEGALDILPLLPFDLRAARVHARLWAALSKKTKKGVRPPEVGANDIFIAAIALANEREVVTLNERDFKKIPGLKVQVLRS